MKSPNLATVLLRSWCTDNLPKSQNNEAVSQNIDQQAKKTVHFQQEKGQIYFKSLANC